MDEFWDVKQSKISQSQKINLIYMRASQIHRKNREEKMGNCLMGTDFVLQDEKFLKTGCPVRI